MRTLRPRKRRIQGGQAVGSAAQDAGARQSEQLLAHVEIWRPSPPGRRGGPIRGEDAGVGERPEGNTSRWAAQAERVGDDASAEYEVAGQELEDHWRERNRSVRPSALSSATATAIPAPVNRTIVATNRGRGSTRAVEQGACRRSDRVRARQGFEAPWRTRPTRTSSERRFAMSLGSRACRLRRSRAWSRGSVVCARRRGNGSNGHWRPRRTGRMGSLGPLPAGTGTRWHSSW